MRKNFRFGTMAMAAMIAASMAMSSPVVSHAEELDANSDVGDVLDNIFGQDKPQGNPDDYKDAPSYEGGIEVDEVGVRLFDDARCLNHGVDETPVYLDSHGAFGVVDGEFFQRFVDRTHEGVGRDEFGVEPVGAEFFAKLAEGGIGDILHGREHQGAFAYFNACYVHRSFR